MNITLRLLDANPSRALVNWATGCVFAYQDKYREGRKPRNPVVFSNQSTEQGHVALIVYHTKSGTLVARQDRR
jgi:hypothetical protein